VTAAGSARDNGPSGSPTVAARHCKAKISLGTHRLSRSTAKRAGRIVRTGALPGPTARFTRRQTHGINTRRPARERFFETDRNRVLHILAALRIPAFGLFGLTKDFVKVRFVQPIKTEPLKTESPPGFVSIRLQDAVRVEAIDVVKLPFQR